MYKNNSGIIAKTKVSKSKKRSLINRKVSVLNPLLFLY